MRGKKPFHPMLIKWSYLYLGSPARIAIKNTTIKDIFTPKIRDDGRKSKKPKGGSHPPRNKITPKLDINRMLAYSAKKNIPKAIPL